MYIYITPRSHTLWHVRTVHTTVYIVYVHISYFLQLDIYLQCAMTMMCPSYSISLQYLHAIILTRYIALILLDPPIIYYILRCDHILSYCLQQGRTKGIEYPFYSLLHNKLLIPIIYNAICMLKPMNAGQIGILSHIAL